MPDNAGNLDGAAQSGYNSTIITVDFFGTAIPGSGADIGAIQTESQAYVTANLRALLQSKSGFMSEPDVDDIESYTLTANRIDTP